MIEEGDKVTFIKPQIVQTDQGTSYCLFTFSPVSSDLEFKIFEISISGPRFVASDLSDDMDGDQKYSVQSFLVTPEELSLLKPSHTWTTSPHSNGQLTIDAKMLRQLSEAGMTIGRQIETSAVDYVLQSTKDAQTVKRFATKFALTESNESTPMLENIFEKIKLIVNDIQEKTEKGVILAATTSMTNGHNGHVNGHTNGHQPDLIQMLSSTIMDCVISMRNAGGEQQCNNAKIKLKHANSSLYEMISQALEEKLGDDFYCDGEDIDDEVADSRRRNMTAALRVIGELLASPIALEQLERRVAQMVKQTIKISKVDLIASTISKNIYNDTEILNNVCAILHGENEDDMIEAVHELYECDPKILYRIVANIKLDANKLTDDDTVAIETVKNGIIAAVKESAANEIKQITADDEYLLDTVALAKALGLTDVAQNVLNAMRSGADVIGKLRQDDNVMDLIERVVVMHKLAKNRSAQRDALQTLRADPYGARKVPAIREMLRRSGICTIRPIAKSKLSDSNEVPISLFCSDNQLAMEDFLMRRQTKSRGAFLIVKEGLQAVVPRECSRDVLTGKCAYTVLDENGIRHFEPLHVFSALKLNLPSLAHRFSMYSCDMVANGDDLEVQKNTTTTTATSTALFKGLTLTNGRDKSIYSPSLNYTSSFNKRRRPHHDLYFNGNQVNKRHSYYF